MWRRGHSSTPVSPLSGQISYQQRQAPPGNWSPLDVQGGGEGADPQPRFGHAAVVHGGRMWVFGGAFSGGRVGEWTPTNDMYTLDMATLIWSKVDDANGRTPPPLASHASFVYDGKWWIFAGGGKDTLSNGLFSWNFSQHEWMEPVTMGQLPSARVGHTGAMVDDKHYVIGGYSQEGGYLNDVRILDFKTMEWRWPKTTGSIPEQAIGRTATAIGHTIYVFGGVSRDVPLNTLYALDTRTLTWTTPAVSGKPPLSRHSHTATRMGENIVFHGGMHLSSTLGDTFFLDIQSLTWLVPEIDGPTPPSRLRHSFVPSEDGSSLILYGGRTHDDRSLGDLHVLTLGGGGGGGEGEEQAPDNLQFNLGNASPRTASFLLREMRERGNE